MSAENQSLRYVGRFAPSPTGPLHFGSLVAAMASYVDARANSGEWIVRMEDLDPPREQKGAAEDIITTLARFGFRWDGPIEYQSRRLDVYQSTIEQLLRNGSAFWCGCSRRHLRGHRVYPGTCINGLPAGRERRSVRVKVWGSIEFDDLVQGLQHQNLDKDVGPFIIRRADGLTAYQIAVVIDDAWQRVTHVVRGSDLLDSTPRQLFLQELLCLPNPQYAHIPVASDEQGGKLSKQSFALPVDSSNPLPTLTAAFHFLGQQNPGSAPNTLDDFWRMAIDQWRLDSVPATDSIAISPDTSSSLTVSD